jgi:solute:Na+ symporter, SSS family
MHLKEIDYFVVVSYIVLIFIIAIGANKYMHQYKIKDPQKQKNLFYSHYLAGGSITFIEALFSIIATEFSALAFMVIPTYVYFDNFSYLKFIIGALISRSLISIYFLPRIYGKGSTIFEILARGVHHYDPISHEGQKGKRTFAFLYISSKVISVGVKLLGGAMLISEFFQIPLFLCILMISLLTYFYILLGGLKAVVRTDILQAMVFILGGLGAHWVIGKMSLNYTWGELFMFGLRSGKMSLWSSPMESLHFLYGILAGIAYDAATHGVDQDLTQKLLGTKNLESAKKALIYSSIGSFILNILFLSLGLILWAYYTKHEIPPPAPREIFSSLITHYFPSPLKGLIIASLLAACMSTLDSSINALSTVFWNDLMIKPKTKWFRVYVNLDNFIITASVVITAYMFSIIPGSMKFAMQFSYLTTAPLLSFFICRMLLSKYIRINNNPSLIIISVLFCFLGMAMNHFRFGFNPQLTILWGILGTIAAMWIYSKLNEFLNSSSEINNE